MTIYYECPWCKRENEEEFQVIPLEYYCDYCGKPIRIEVKKLEEEEDQ